MLALVPGAFAADVSVTDDITGNVTWTKNNEYYLDGFIYVLDGATLTIEAGTVIKGLQEPSAGTGETASALLVTQGGKLMAEGTASEPIIFTSEYDDVTDPDALGIFERGLWGGVVLFGKATINTSSNTAGDAANPKYDVFEGLPDTQIGAQFVNRFGGNDDTDNSGVLRYVSIRHAGVVFLPNKELNGLSLGAVGNGTTIEHVECYATADDGFEFFGGAVNTKWLVSAFNDDDCFDTDQGYHGKNQFWFAIQENGKRDNGGEWNGEPNDIAVSNAPLANFTVYNMTLIGAGAASANTAVNHGFTIREYSAPRVYNSIITDFRGNGIRITDDRSGAMLNAGIMDFRDNLWWSFHDPVAGERADVLFNESARRNDVVDPLLAGISRINDNGLDPRPMPYSPALCGSRTPPNDGFYSQVSYKGAFDATDLWVDGWTFLAAKGFLATSPAAVPPAGQQQVAVSADISGNVTWYRTNEYVLDGFIYVLNGAVLNIEAGTVIKGVQEPSAGTGETASALLVTQGGRIYARGNEDYPIIFTSEYDDVTDPDALGIFERGLWGGVVLFGKATINTSSNTAGDAANPKYDVFEGLPDTQIGAQFVNRFGGNNDGDDSGVLCYVSIRHSGVVFLPNKELNGLSLGAVGNGTTVDHVECYAIADDGFEFFGGAVNTKWLVSAFNDDDCFDTDQGYHGKNQFWFAIQENGKRDNGGEWNGEPNDIAVSNAPLANFMVYNMTLIGAGANSANTALNHGFTIREYSAPRVYNSIITDFRGNGIRITDDRSGAMLTAGIMDFRDNLWWSFHDPVAGERADVLFSDTTRSNEVVNPLLTSISRTNDNRLDPRPAAGSPALTSNRQAPDDGFFAPVAYKGAFDANNLWLQKWTFLDAKGFLGSAAGPMAPTLTITSDAMGTSISFMSEAGVSYLLKSTTDLASPITWSDEGIMTGTGGMISFVVTTGDPAKFYQVLAQ